MSIFEQVNQIDDEEYIAKVAGLTKANDGRSWVCPVCGDGSHGGKGDGIKLKEFCGEPRWHCYGCGKHWSNSNLLAEVEGIREQAELARRLEEIFPECKDNAPSFLLGERSQRLKGTNDLGGDKVGGDAREKPRRDYSAWYSKCRVRLGMRLQRGETIRGLNFETLFKVGAGLAQDFMGTKYPPHGVDALILPYDKYRYFARGLECGLKYFTRDAPRSMYVVNQLVAGRLNFVTEGEIDALSIGQAIGIGNAKVGVGAMGSKGFYRRLVGELEKTYSGKIEKPWILYVADNDDLNAAQAYVDELRKAGYPAEYVTFAGANAAKVDANDFMQKNGVDALRNFLREQYQTCIGKLRSQSERFKAALAKRAS